MELFFDEFQMKLSIKWGSEFRQLISTILAGRENFNTAHSGMGPITSEGYRLMRRGRKFG